MSKLAALHGLFLVLALIGLGCASTERRDVAPESLRSPWTLWSGSAKDLQSVKLQPRVGTRGMVVTDSPLATAAGQDVLDRGGNAVDAAVAAAFTLAVSRPHYGSIGGGGFMLVCPPKAAPCRALDYRERAPRAMTRDFFVRAGKVRTDLSQNGALASGVPGVVAGLLHALERYGSRNRSTVMDRAIQLASDGVILSAYTESAANERRDAFNPEAMRLFGCKDCTAGMRLKQPELARVLREVRSKGRAGFYDGWVARKLVDGLGRAGGVMTTADLAAYRVREFMPLSTRVFDAEILTMPPPSAGGALLIQLLGYADRARLETTPGAMSSSTRIHALSHAMSLAFSDRAAFFGDPDFFKVPLDRLLSAAYLDERWSTFAPNERRKVEAQAVSPASDSQHLETTHLAVIDPSGWAVSLTTTINDNFGSGFVPPGTGVVMNNEMDDFSLEPGTPNLFGLVGSEANAIAPGKTPLSSMTPTIVRDLKGQNRIAIGASGGPRITTAVFLSLVARLKDGLSLTDAVMAPRFHHQWKPERLVLETGAFSREVRSELELRRWTLAEVPSLAKVKAVEAFIGTGGGAARFWGIADYRGEGSASGFAD